MVLAGVRGLDKTPQITPTRKITASLPVGPKKVRRTDPPSVPDPKKIWGRRHPRGSDPHIWGLKGQTEPDPQLLQGVGGTDISARAYPFTVAVAKIPHCAAGRRRRSRLLRESPGRFRPQACYPHPPPPFPAIEGPRRPHRGAPQPPPPAAGFWPLVRDSEGTQPFPRISGRRNPRATPDRS
jgi:hypothetical protein